MNILDLGLFNSIRNWQHLTHAYSVPDLVAAVCTVYYKLRVRTLEKCLLTSQAVLGLITLAERDNDYDLLRVRSVHFPSGEFPLPLRCSDVA